MCLWMAKTFHLRSCPAIGGACMCNVSLSLAITQIYEQRLNHLLAALNDAFSPLHFTSNGQLQNVKSLGQLYSFSES